MVILIIIFATLILLGGVVLVVKPDVIFGLLGDHIDNFAVHVIAVVTRLLVGVLLITESNHSKFPVLIDILGFIFIVAGISLAVIGRNRFRRLISWVIDSFKPFGRLAGIVAVIFGGFLVYAFQ